MTANQTAAFDDLIEANRRYRLDFHDSGVAGGAAKAAIEAASGADTAGREFLATTDHLATLKCDLDIIRSCLRGFTFYVHGGGLVPVPA